MDRWRIRISSSLESNQALPVIIGVGLLLRIAVLQWVGRHPLVSDATDYHQMASDLLTRGSWSCYYPPGMAYYLAGFYAVFGIHGFVARVCMVPLYVALALLLHGLVRTVATRRAANVAVLMISIWPVHILQSVEPLSQLPTAVCLMVVAYCTVRWLQQPPDALPWGLAAAMGLALAGAVLLRPSSLLLAVLLPAGLLVARRSARVALVPVLIVATASGAWLMKAHAMTGRFVRFNDANSANLFFGNNPYTPLYKTWWFGSHRAPEPGVPPEFSMWLEEIRRQPPEVRDRLFSRYAREHVCSRPDLFALRTFNRMCTSLAFDSSSAAVLRSAYRLGTGAMLGLIGLGAAFHCAVMVLAILCLFQPHARQRHGPHAWILAGVVLGYALPYWLAFSHPTYQFPVTPLFVAMAALRADDWLGIWRPGPRGPALPEAVRMGWLARLAILAFLLIQCQWVALNLSRV